MLFLPIVKYLNAVIGFINGVLVPVVFALAFLAFLWGVYQYFIAGGANDEQRETGRKFVMWAIIGFVIMLSLWGIIRVLMVSLGFGGDIRPNLPLFEAQEKKPLSAVCAPNAHEECASGVCAYSGLSSDGQPVYRCK